MLLLLCLGCYQSLQVWWYHWASVLICKKTWKMFCLLVSQSHFYFHLENMFLRIEILFYKDTRFKSGQSNVQWLLLVHLWTVFSTDPSIEALLSPFMTWFWSLEEWDWFQLNQLTHCYSTSSRSGAAENSCPVPSDCVVMVSPPVY